MIYTPPRPSTCGPVEEDLGAQRVALDALGERLVEVHTASS